MFPNLSSCPTDNTGDQEGGRLQNPYLDYHWQYFGGTLIVSPTQSRPMEGKRDSAHWTPQEPSHPQLLVIGEHFIKL